MEQRKEFADHVIWNDKWFSFIIYFLLQKCLFSSFFSLLFRFFFFVVLFGCNCWWIQLILETFEKKERKFGFLFSNIFELYYQRSIWRKIQTNPSKHKYIQFSKVSHLSPNFRTKGTFWIEQNNQYLKTNPKMLKISLTTKRFMHTPLIRFPGNKTHATQTTTSQHQQSSNNSQTQQTPQVRKNNWTH